MGWFASLVGSDRAIDSASNLAQKGLSIIDDAFLTDDEKQEYKKKSIENWLHAQELINNSSTATSISRRMVSWSVIGTSLLVILSCVVLSLFEMDSNVDKILLIAEKTKLNWAFCSVIVFYYGPHLLNRK